MTITQRPIFKILCVIILLFAIKCLTHYNRAKLDGISGELFGMFLSPETVYAIGYSDKKFAEVKPGMTENQVIQLLGEPINTFNPYPSFKDSVFAKGFQYSHGRDLDAHFRLRIIYVRKGIVYETRSRLNYTD